MKRKQSVVAILLILLILASCAVPPQTNETENETPGTPVATEQTAGNSEISSAQTLSEQTEPSSQPEPLRDITVEELERALKDKETMVVLFSRDSCGACTSSKPNVEEASRLLDIPVYYLDADKSEGSELLSQYGVQLSPALLIVQNGELTRYEAVFTLDLARCVISTVMQTTLERPNEVTDVRYRELEEMLSDDKDFLLYIGSEDCPDCQHFDPILEDYVENHPGAGVFHFDTKQYRTSVSEEEYEAFKDFFDLTWVPSVYHIRNGKIIAEFEYLSSEYYELDEDEQKEMEAKYQRKFSSWMGTNA